MQVYFIDAQPGADAAFLIAVRGDVRACMARALASPVAAAAARCRPLAAVASSSSSCPALCTAASLSCSQVCIAIDEIIHEEPEGDD